MNGAKNKSLKCHMIAVVPFHVFFSFTGVIMQVLHSYTVCLFLGYDSFVYFSLAYNIPNRLVSIQ